MLTNKQGRCELYVAPSGSVIISVNGRAVEAYPFTDIGKRLYALPDPNNFITIDYARYTVKILPYYNRLLPPRHRD